MRCYIKRIINDFVHAMGARNMALIARFATGLFNAALRALLNRPVAQLANRAIFVPIAFTIIDYLFTISWPVRYASVYIILHVCVTQSATHGTVEIRMTIGCAQWKRNLDLISVLHCHVRAHSSRLRNINCVVCNKLKIDCPAKFKPLRSLQFWCYFSIKKKFLHIVDE